MNTLFAVSGNSGAGKTTLFRSLEGLKEIVSFTTRPKREGEVDGVDYHFITSEQYFQLMDSGAVIESAMYDGNVYGVSAHEFYGKLSASDCFMIVEFHGMNTVKLLHPKVASIFVYNHREHAEACMRDRGDNPEKIAKRLSTYAYELNNRRFYDYVVKNPYGKQLGTRNALQNIVQNESENLGKTNILSPVAQVTGTTLTQTPIEGVMMNDTGNA